MAKPSNDRHRLFVAQAEKDVLGNLRYGVVIERQLGVSIDDLIKKTSVDRFHLASAFLRAARKNMKARPAQFRSSISRAYYAMYHAARAVSYISHGGDDYQEHSKLSEKFPDDFPDYLNWRNRLRAARLARNRADYEPYPISPKKLEDECKNTLVTAQDFLTRSEQYLRAKGCSL
jgi:uncharacterized protein (UPF0332 family)